MNDMDMLNSPLIAERYFFPSPARLRQRITVKVNGASLACGATNLNTDMPVLVHFHGNGEAAADWEVFLPGICQSIGLACFLAEYRGYGESSGTPLLGDLLLDVEKILKATGRKPEDIIVFGRSVGSIFAAEAINIMPNLKGLIIESGIYDVRERLELRVLPDELGVTYDFFNDVIDRNLNQKEKLERFKGSSLVMHARNDDLIDVSHAENLFEALPEPKRITIFERGDHNTVLPVNAPDYVAELRSFVNSLNF